MCFILVFTVNSHASVITFDDAISGATTYQFDSDSDGIMDVIFSTSDSSGFNTVGPGTNMTYISEPGLEGTALLNTDLRVDFLNQANNSLSFGYALDSGSANINTWTKFFVYDAGGNLLASANSYGQYTYPNGVNQSNFPEGEISVSFSGIASYALFDFNSDAGRYIIDNFSGTYGSTEVPPNAPVPEPSTFILFGAGLAGVGLLRRRVRK
jgi:hypothetical protein